MDSPDVVYPSAAPMQGMRSCKSKKVLIYEGMNVRNQKRPEMLILPTLRSVTLSSETNTSKQMILLIPDRQRRTIGSTRRKRERLKKNGVARCRSEESFSHVAK